MDFEKILQENHGKEVLVITRDEHHYQGLLVGCQCRSNQFECTHYIIRLLDVNYVDVPVKDIVEVKILEETNKPSYHPFISG